MTSLTMLGKVVKIDAARARRETRRKYAPRSKQQRMGTRMLDEEEIAKWCALIDRIRKKRMKPKPMSRWRRDFHRKLAAKGLG